MRPQTKRRWLDLITQFRDSSLTFDQFAAIHDVNPSTLKKYYYRLRSEIDQPAFLPVHVSDHLPEVEAVDQTSTAHVDLKGQLHFSSLPSPEYLASFLRALRTEAS